MDIENLVNFIRLNQNEIQNVSYAKDNLIETIKSKARNKLLPMPKDVFLTGSYKRGTKISPLDDVDIFYVIGYALKKYKARHIITDCSFKYGVEFEDNEGKISSIKILNLIKQELSKTYSKSEIRRNGEVVNVYLRSYEVGFDVVPAWEIAGSEYYLIPNGGGSTKWKKSNPKIDEYILNRLNDKHKNLLKNTIRVMKYWFKKKKIKSPRTYHLESIAYYIFSIKDPISSYKESLIYFFENINYNNYLIRCPDPTNLSGNLSSSLDKEDIKKILNEADNAIKYLKEGEEKFIKYVEPEL
ncbi:SMODS domain-containing nucleotidyltransferase [Thermoanaerobacterium thermosaccharolyticum]|uniref:SMODS domain-containing nucleotidyltransferase n=1 Tax=Thermoanaerobacterium thermosaccharolyticum TaxID=1517 RepID=UPI003DA934CE